MSDNRTTSTAEQIIPRPLHSVKAIIVASGVSMRALAAKAGMAESTLSEHVNGKWRVHDTQARILATFNQLTGQSLTHWEFWRIQSARRCA